MKKFRVKYDDISETGYYSSGTTDYGIILAENSDEARKIVADRVITDGIVLMHGVQTRTNFGNLLTVFEIKENP